MLWSVVKGFIVVWHQSIMMTSSNGNIFSVTGSLCRWPVNSPHKGQWRTALVFSLICTWTNGWVNNRDVGDLRGHRAQYDVTVMFYLYNFNVTSLAERQLPHFQWSNPEECGCVCIRRNRTDDIITTYPCTRLMCYTLRFCMNLNHFFHVYVGGWLS